MINSVSKLIAPTLDGIKPLQSTAPTDGPSFTEVLGAALDKLNGEQIQADQMTEALATGQAPDLHSVTIASEKSMISFQLAVQVRNKALEAYQEIMRMQI
jgi:flagellar hook-basal body complex protein FliE